jgi:hypothetical protein
VGVNVACTAQALRMLTPVSPGSDSRVVGRRSCAEGASGKGTRPVGDQASTIMDLRKRCIRDRESNWLAAVLISGWRLMPVWLRYRGPQAGCAFPSGTSAPVP